MSKQVQFVMDDDDYAVLVERSGGKSANLKARDLLLRALYGEKETADETLRLTIKTLTFVRRLALDTLGAEKLGPIILESLKDEKALCIKLGVDCNE